MKNHRLFTVFGILLSSILMSSAHASGSEFTKYAEDLSSIGVVKYQSSEALYRLQDNITRGETSAIVARTSLGEEDIGSYDSSFYKDVKETSEFKNYIGYLAEIGAVSKDRSYFYPSNNITRAEFIKMTTSTLGMNQDNIESFQLSDWSAPYKDIKEEWQKKYIRYAYDNGIISSSNMFRPNDYITRGEAFKILSLIILSDSSNQEERNNSNNTNSGSQTNTGSTSTPSTTYSASMSIDGIDTINSISLPSGAVGAKVGTFMIKETSGVGDISINNIQISKSGLASNSSIKSVSLAVDGIRIASIKQFNSDGVIDFSLNKPITIKKGEGKNIDVIVSIADKSLSSGAEFKIKINNVSYLLDGNSVKKDVSLLLNKVNVVGVDVAIATFSINDTFSSPKSGETQKELSSFKIYNSSGTDKIALKKLAIRHTGSARLGQEINNVTLYDETGKQISKGIVNGDFVHFTISEGTINQYKYLRLVVKADISGGYGRTVKFELYDPIDVYIETLSQGYPIAISGDIGRSELNILTGEVVLGQLDIGNVQLSSGKKNVNLAKFKLTSNSGEGILLEQIGFNVSVTGTGASPSDFLENVRLVEDVSNYSYNATWRSTTSSGGYYTITNAGHYIKDSKPVNFSLVADIKNLNSTDLAKLSVIKFDVKTYSSGNDGMKIYTYNDNRLISDITPSTLSFSSVEGNTSQSKLTLLPLSISKNAVIGSKNVTALEFEINNTSSLSNVLLKQLKVDGSFGSGTIDRAVISSISLYKDSISDSNLVKTITSSNFSNQIGSFDRLQRNISPNSKVKYIVTVNFIDDIVNIGKITKLGVNYVSLTDSNGDDIYVNGSSFTLSGSQYISDRSITLTGNGTITASVNNSDIEADRFKSIIGGGVSPIIGSFDINVVGEKIKLKDFDIIASEQSVGDFKKSVSEVVILSKDKTEVARQSVTSDIVSFTNLSVILQEGTNTFYVKVITRKIGKDEPGKKSEGLKLALSIKKSEGVDSLKTVVNPVNTAYSNEFSVYPVRVSNIETISSYAGISVSSKLVNGDNNLAIVKISADTWNNTLNSDGSTLKLLLSQVKGSFSKLAGTTINSFTIEKIGGVNTPITGVVSGSSITFDTSTLGNDKSLDSGGIGYFLIKANVTKDNVSTNDDYLKFQFDTFSNGEISYKSNESLDTAITKLGLQINRLELPQINE